MTEQLKKGDRVRIKLHGGIEEGVVMLASENGRSLMLAFEGFLGGYVGLIPILETDGSFRDLFTNTLVEVTKL